MTNLGDFAQSRGDVMRRLHELERQVQRMRAERRLEASTIGRGGLRIKGGALTVEENGDIIVTGGGGVTVSGGGGVSVGDGGGLTIDDGGNLDVRGNGLVRWFGAGGAQRFGVGNIPPDTAPSDERVRLIYRDTGGNQRVIAGEIVDVDTGDLVGHGILVEGAAGTDLLTAHDIRTWIGNPNGTGLRLNESDPGVFHFRRPGDAMSGLVVDIAATATHLAGGSDAAGALWTRIILTGNGTAEVRARDGADSTYVPMAASAFVVRASSARDKEVLGDLADLGSPLATVVDVPVKRWRHLSAPRPAVEKGEDAGPTEDAPEHLGPMAEDVPPEMASWVGTEGGVDITASLWTLWGAVQEQQKQIAELQAQVAELTAPD